MTFAFIVFAFGAVMLYAGVKGRSISDVLSGVTSQSGPASLQEDTAFLSELGGGDGAGGATTTDASLTSGGSPSLAGANPSANGDWGGSKSVVDRAVAIGSSHGLQVTSTKRATQMTLSGGVSDHWVGCKTNYAADQSGGVPQMDAAAKEIAQAFGFPDWKGVQTIHAGGYRIQLLYRTLVGGNHFNHIHVGAKRDGI